MIYARPGETFRAVMADSPTGLTWGVAITDGAGTVVTARAATGIVEEAPGVYTATRTAPATTGVFTVIWDHGTGTYWPEQLTVTTAPTGAAIPSVLDVALVCRSRTRDSAGNELGTFTTATRPTATDVDGLIGIVAGQVAAVVAGPSGVLAAPLQGEARAATIYGVAALIEEGFFPEQNQGPDAPAARHHQRYREALDQLAHSQRAYAASASRGGGIGLGSMVIRGAAAAGV